MPAYSELFLTMCLAATAALPSQTSAPQTAGPSTVAQTIQRLAGAEGVQRFRLGLSNAGREIEGLRFGDPGSPLNRPAILVVANLSGLRPQAGEVALALGERLGAPNAEAQALVEAATIFVIPEPNPDAVALAAVTPLHESAATGTGRDTDRDGLIGEDPPADVDGDGLITWMRVPDAKGTWIADPEDARANIEADAGHAERGLWRIVREGFDADGDGEIAEDHLLDAEVNHNFPAGFEEHTATGGLFAGNEPEARALMDFVLEHPEIVLVVTIDDQDTLISAPETTKDPENSGRRFFFGPRELPDGKLLESDATVLAELGRRFQQHAEDAPEASGMQAGSFQRWCYEQRGILTLDSVLWVMPTEAPKAEENKDDESDTSTKASPDSQPATVESEAATSQPSNAEEESDEEESWREASDDAGRLAWVDATGETWRFVEWHPFEHPKLGPVEIGGWAPYARLWPPADVVERVTNEQWQLLTGLTSVIPQAAVAEFTAEDLGRGLWRIEARIENPELLPIGTRAAARARTSTRIKVHLELPSKASLIAGRTPEFVARLDGLGRPDEDAEFTWLVHAKKIEGLSIEVSTRNAGDAKATVTIKEAR